MALPLGNLTPLPRTLWNRNATILLTAEFVTVSLSQMLSLFPFSYMIYRSTVIR